MTGVNDRHTAKNKPMLSGNRVLQFISQIVSHQIGVRDAAAMEVADQSVSV